MGVELIERRDAARVAEFDALFIRATTAVDHWTYRIARRAEREGLVVMDDPASILRCANKVFLAEALAHAGLPTPRTLIAGRRDLVRAARLIGLPLVLKVPDGSFSRGMAKVEQAEALRPAAAVLFEDSDLLIAQEFVYTPFDWRIGVLNGRPLYACQYFMARSHWQIYAHAGDRVDSGGFRTWPVEEAPAEVVATAVRAAALIGNGFYGVDLKQTERGVMVIEINDNPSVDAGVEDAVLKGQLYLAVMQEFQARLRQRFGMTAAGGG